MYNQTIYMDYFLGHQQEHKILEVYDKLIPHKLLFHLEVMINKSPLKLGSKVFQMYDMDKYKK
jgi:hypothetical protein